jgi:hypothetical protein
VKTDNGSDFVAHATRRLFAALGIAAETSAPFEPRQKGVVERAIGTFQRACAVLPGFVGHNVADRRRIENRKAFNKRLGADASELFGVDLTLKDFQAWCDDWAGTVYAHNPHRALGMRTPFAAAAAWQGPVKRISDDKALAVLLAPVPGKDGLRVVTKQGIRINGAHYLTGDVMPGTQVLVRHDPADLGNIWLFEPGDTQFLGRAACPELAGLDPAETIERVRAAQKAHLDGAVADIKKEMRRIGPRQIADAQRQAVAARAGKLIAFPRPAEAHKTAALDAAGRAVRAHEPQPLSARARQIHEAMQDEAPPPLSVDPPSSSSAVSAAPVSPARGEIRALPETAAQRYRRARDAEEKLAAGASVEPALRRWLDGYRKSAEYWEFKLREEEGEEALRGNS